MLVALVILATRGPLRLRINWIGNLEVAKVVGVDDKTVATVREGERNSEFPKNVHLPAERAKTALREKSFFDCSQLIGGCQTNGWPGPTQQSPG